MNRIHVVWFVFLLTLAAAPCSAQKVQAPLSAATTQGKKQNDMPQFTHAELVQFVHTVQTEAAGWKDTINSIEPSALHIDGDAATIIESCKSHLLRNLNHIRVLDLREISKGKDLYVEFKAFSDLGDVVENLGQLVHTLSSYASGQIDGAELLQIEKEVRAARLTLYGEILSRLVSIHQSEALGQCQW